jgi:hypothetical protein
MPHAALLAVRLRASEDISLAPECLNQWLSGFAIDLCAKATQMDIEIICFWFKADAPNLFQNHGAGNNPACVSAQIL